MSQASLQSLEEPAVHFSIGNSVASAAHCSTQGPYVSAAAKSMLSTPGHNKPWATCLEALRKTQDGVSINDENSQRCPTQDDFEGLPISMTITILPQRVDRPASHCMVLFHKGNADKRALQEMSLRIQEEFEECVFIMLQICSGCSLRSRESHTHETSDGLDARFLPLIDAILVKFFKQSLISKCGFLPRSLVVFGHGEAGAVALALIAIWDRVEFGGVITIDSLVPTLYHPASAEKPMTPALILGSNHGIIDGEVMDYFKRHFDCMDFDNQVGKYDSIPGIEDLQPIHDFLKHRLRRDEWNKKAVLCFDGGGIRGYASLIILRCLMEKIGKLERRLNPGIESSFAPHMYKPTKPKYTDRLWFKKSPDNTSPSNPDPVIVITPLPSEDSSLFLRCHYFDYGAGTSTGGFIAIMLFCLRMTVSDCIEIYKSIGDKAFGRERKLSMGGILWDKYSSKNLERVIMNVTGEHSVKGTAVTGFDLRYEIGEGLPQCVALAYAENKPGEDVPFLLRTYDPPTGTDPIFQGLYKKFKPDRPLYPYEMSLHRVARATSAAPGRFKPVLIPAAYNGGKTEWIRFKDGGFGSNNPSEEMYRDIIEAHGDSSKSIGPFVSIGTGKSRLTKFASTGGHFRELWTYLQAVKKMPTLTSLTHRSIVKESHRDGKTVFPYYRFDGGEDLGAMVMDEWEADRWGPFNLIKGLPGSRTLRGMDEAIEKYLSDGEVQKQLDECARILVQRRRLRLRDASGWERYASTSAYVCNRSACENARKAPIGEKPCHLTTAAHFNTLQDFKDHLKATHGIEHDEGTLTHMLNQCRVYWWLYPGWNSKPQVPG